MFQYKPNRKLGNALFGFHYMGVNAYWFLRTLAHVLFTGLSYD